MMFFDGTGANGKSVLVRLDNYHQAGPIETFTGTTSHPTDLGGLMGARLVTADEIEEGRRWAEYKIKTLTGGNKILARSFCPRFATSTSFTSHCEAPGGAPPVL